MSQFQEPNFPAIFTQSYTTLREFDKNLITVLGAMGLNLKAILDAGISFDDNLDISRTSVTSHGTPGTQFSVSHGLGKIPVGYIVYGQDGAGSIFDGVTANTSSLFYFKSDVASITFRILFF